ncbi:hypothetical protein [Cupriavidus sp. IDO]|uniref:hypothetical protein n=1 Tax=Cupriavidus sp. IDO TaxID=1539142 RepID=UPI00057900B4|nr:hypothetical protein [Cupriavidus sp. IDO]KWR88043.1 hypothetical protein RM96_21595 [Cupriavidus sp. IDO]
MKQILSFSLMAMAVLATASGAAQGQQVAGGMGEEVRIGAFATAPRGKGYPGLRDSRTMAARPGKETARSPRPLGARGPAPTLPGRHLP